MGSSRSTEVDTGAGHQRPPLRLGLTSWTFVPTLAAVASLFVGYCFGVIPWWANWLAATPLYCYVLICAHDALHGSAHGNPCINQLVGWVGTAVFALPYPVVRRAHLSHHDRTGKPDDIERFAYRLGWTLPLRWLFGNLMYYAILPKCKAGERILAVGALAVAAGLVLAWPEAAGLGWVLPMQTTVLIFIVSTIYLPHGRFAAWINATVPVVTGFHEAHHAQMGFPWHQIIQIKVQLARPGAGSLAQCREEVVGGPPDGKRSRELN